MDKLETALLGSNQTQVLGGEIRETGWPVVLQDTYMIGGITRVMDGESTVSVIRASAIAVVLITLVFLGYRYDKRRVRAAILRCAREHGYDVLATEEYFLSSGPFGWGTSGRARVFRVRVADASKTEKYVWIRVGSFWVSPIFDDRTEFMSEDV